MVEMVPTAWTRFEAWWSWWYLVGYLLVGMAVAISVRVMDDSLDDEPGLLSAVALLWPLVLCSAVFFGFGILVDLTGKEVGKAVDGWKQRRYERRDRQ